jgi:hypothetical protein
MHLKPQLCGSFSSISILVVEEMNNCKVNEAQIWHFLDIQVIIKINIVPFHIDAN